jgi:ABC-type antimicrobial peptide transport system permease subunit
LDVLDLITMTAEMDDTVGRERIVARLSQLFAGAALLLACIGLYGVMAYAVARRTTEIGIRMALGAPPGTLARSVVLETMRMVALGLALGVPAALAAAWYARQLLFDLSPADPVTLAMAALLLTTVALVAGWLPARRAANIDPLNALRCE